jgi:CAAX protease family protein
MNVKWSSNTKQSILFLAITFFITYTCWLILAAIPDLKYGTPLFMVLYLVGGFGPTISALIVMKSNKELTKDYLKRLLNWRINPLLYVLVLFIVVLICVLLVIINNKEQYKVLDWYMVFPLFISMIIGGGLEELGWRGILQDSLNKEKWNIILSSLIIGIIWAFWHLPLFYINGVYQYQGNFILFFVNVIGLSLIYTVLYTMSNSILLCIIFHALINVSAAMGFDVPRDNEFGLIIRNSIPLLVGAVVMLVYLIVKNRRGHIK